jgi:hypothetical protein
MVSVCPYAAGRAKESETMLKNRLGRIALAAVLSFGVLSVGTTQSSAIDEMNGFHGPYRVIKNYAAVGFQYNAWRSFTKKQTTNHECSPRVKDTCWVDVASQVFFDNCTTSAGGTVECGVGEAQPLGGIPEGFGVRYVCEKGAIVKTVSNLLFIPRT